MRNLITWVVVIVVLGGIGFFMPRLAPEMIAVFQQGTDLSEYDQALLDCRSGDTQREISGCTWLIESGEVDDDEMMSLAHHNRGLAHAAQGNDEDAFADYDAAIRYDPEDYITYYVRGYLHQVREEYETAIADYTLALERYDEDPDVYRDRAFALYYERKYEESIRDLEAALKLDPDDAETLNSLAWTLLTLGRVEEAEQVSARSLEQDEEKYAGSLDTYAHILAELGRHQEAFDYFVKAARVGDSDYVRTIQEALTSKGFLSSPPDGVMTGRTREALKACIAQNCRLQLDDFLGGT